MKKQMLIIISLYYLEMQYHFMYVSVFTCLVLIWLIIIALYLNNFVNKSKNFVRAGLQYYGYGANFKLLLQYGDICCSF